MGSSHSQTLPPGKKSRSIEIDREGIPNGINGRGTRRFSLSDDNPELILQANRDRGGASTDFNDSVSVLGFDESFSHLEGIPNGINGRGTRRFSLSDDNPELNLQANRDRGGASTDFNDSVSVLGFDESFSHLQIETPFYEDQHAKFLMDRASRPGKNSQMTKADQEEAKTRPSRRGNGRFNLSDNYPEHTRSYASRATSNKEATGILTTKNAAKKKAYLDSIFVKPREVPYTVQPSAYCNDRKKEEAAIIAALERTQQQKDLKIKAPKM